jgi:hypothetical protein
MKMGPPKSTASRAWGIRMGPPKATRRLLAGAWRISQPGNGAFSSLLIANRRN